MSIEQRLSLVEAGLSQVQQRLGIVSSPANWVEQVAGSLADIPEVEYQQFLECCRAIRNGGPVAAAEDQCP